MGNVNCQSCQNLAQVRLSEQFHSVSLTSALETIIQEFRQKHAPRSEKLIGNVDGSNPMYNGQLKNGERHGYGELRKDKNLYYGYFKSNLPDGQGLLIKDLNSLVWGIFKKGKTHGVAFQKTSDFQFNGEFELGKRKKGQLKTQTYTYQGQFQNNLFDGQGSIQYKTGEIYQGSFKAGKFHGNGKFKSNNGIYTGMFKNGLYHGLGTYEWNDGSLYDGQYEGGQKNGIGRFFKEQLLYEGTWKSGKPYTKQQGGYCINYSSKKILEQIQTEN